MKPQHVKFFITKYREGQTMKKLWYQLFALMITFNVASAAEITNNNPYEDAAGVYDFIISDGTARMHLLDNGLFFGIFKYSSSSLRFWGNYKVDGSTLTYYPEISRLDVFRAYGSSSGAQTTHKPLTVKFHNYFMISYWMRFLAKTNNTGRVFPQFKGSEQFVTVTLEKPKDGVLTVKHLQDKTQDSPTVKGTRFKLNHNIDEVIIYYRHGDAERIERVTGHPVTLGKDNYSTEHKHEITPFIAEGVMKKIEKLKTKKNHKYNGKEYILLDVLRD